MHAIDVIELIVEVLILLLLLYLAFLKSYFQEKGKNLATKEDVEEIASKVELIRSAVNFSLEAKLSWREEEHNSLVEYYSKYGLWLAGITSFSLSGISDENMDRLEMVRDRLDDLYRDFQIAYNRMELFVENEEIVRQEGELELETYKFHAHASDFTFEYGKLCLEMEAMKAVTPVAKQVEPYSELLGMKTDLYKKFKEEQKGFYDALLPLVFEHRRAISDHLRSLITSND